MHNLFWISVLCFLVAGIVGLSLGKSQKSGIWRWGLISVGTLLQVIVGVRGLVSGDSALLANVPGIPPFGEWTFSLDPLGSLLMTILGFVGVIATVYGLGESLNGRDGTNRFSSSLVALQFVFTSFLLTAQSAIPLLIAWEGMSLCAYGYIVTRHEIRRVRHSGFVTLAVSEVGFLALVIAVVLATPATGLTTFAALHASLMGHSAAYSTVVLILALIGFGVKSGILPMQMWMPRAYQVTPAHLNVLLAGGLLNLGIFGVLRVLGWVGTVPAVVGTVVSLIGATAVFIGALYAVFERNLPVLLAYSSIENVGFMLIAIGLTVSFHATHSEKFASVAMIAMVIQMVSHALAKSLSFLSIGEVHRRTGSTDLDVLGGISRQMPIVAAGILIASLTLAAVAPFSGFASEWLTLQSMLQAYRTFSAFEQGLIVLAGALTAIGSALAFTAFLRLFAFLFTGRLRTPAITSRIVQSGRAGIASTAIVLTGFLSAAYGFFPTSVIPAYGRVVSFVTSSATVTGDVTPNIFHQPGQFAAQVNLGAGFMSFLPMPSAIIQPGAGVSSIAPTYVLAWFIIFGLLALLIRRVLKRSGYQSRLVKPWAGGRQLAFETAEYTPTAYSNPYRMFFSSLLRFRVERQVTSGSTNYPTAVSVQTTTRQWLHSGIYQKWLGQIRKRLTIVRYVQHGYLWAYMVTFLLALMILLLWAYWT